MQKSVYSIVLSDDVVTMIDRLAYRNNTNRSNMINQILAEYVSYVTPEKRMQDTIRRVEAILGGADTFQVLMQPTDSTLTVRSAIAYKYNPSVRYAIELYRTYGDAVGELRVSLRSQNSSLLLYLSQFFRLWMGLEAAYLPQLDCHMEDGRLTRRLRPTRVHGIGPVIRELSSESLGDLLYGYIDAFDRALKSFFYMLDTPAAATAEIERIYRDYLSSHEIVL
ncbi:MAG: hypothetical protein J6S76_06390 [Clostridia bacterium]|nr:hypothetical protein [Clostridia bacterium]